MTTTCSRCRRTLPANVRRDRRYCSDACRKAAERARKRAETARNADKPVTADDGARTWRWNDYDDTDPPERGWVRLTY